MAKSSAMRVGVITAAQFAVALAIFLWPVSGWAQAAFTPTTNRQTAARPAPAKVTSEADSALTSKSYVRIGTIRASQPGKKGNAEAVQELEAAILKQAAEAGGDVVRFSSEGAPETLDVPTGKTKTKKYCEKTSTQTVSGTPTSSTYCYTDVHGFAHFMTTNTPTTREITTCVKWGEPEEIPITRKEQDLVSEGTVWRYDPKWAADIARAAETARAAEAARHVAEAARQAAEAARQAPETIREAGQAEAAEAFWRAGPAENVKALLAQGADVNVKDNEGRTPLHQTARYRNKELAELLLSHGANVNAKDNSGDTPLHAAASYPGHTELVELLLAHGADVNAKGKNGETPLHSAEMMGNANMADLLRQHGGHK